MKSIIAENCSQFISIDSIDSILYTIKTPDAPKETTKYSLSTFVIDNDYSPTPTKYNRSILAQQIPQANSIENEMDINDENQVSVQDLQLQINVLKQQSHDINEVSIKYLQLQIDELNQQLNKEIKMRESSEKHLKGLLESQIASLKLQIEELATKVINFNQQTESNVSNLIKGMENKLEIQYKTITSKLDVLSNPQPDTKSSCLQQNPSNTNISADSSNTQSQVQRVQTQQQQAANAAAAAAAQNSFFQPTMYSDVNAAAASYAAAAAEGANYGNAAQNPLMSQAQQQSLGQAAAQIASNIPVDPRKSKREIVGNGKRHNPYNFRPRKNQGN
jgi:hypothetical protein